MLEALGYEVKEPEIDDDEATDAELRRLVGAVAHEVRNPLTTIRTFAELLPEHFGDPAFRERFTELVGRDVAHIDDVVTRLARAAEREKEEAGPVHVTALIERLLDERRERIGAGEVGFFVAGINTSARSPNVTTENTSCSLSESMM